MLIRTPRVSTATTALLLASLGLAGCSTGQNSTVTHTPALQTTGGRDSARSSVQTAILLATSSNGIVLPGGPTPVSIARKVLAIVDARRTRAVTGTSTGTCTSGVKSSQTTGTDGSVTTITDYYYDAACATLETEELINVATPATPTSTIGSGSIKTYDRSGNLRVIQSLAFNVATAAATATTAATETFALTGNAAATAGGTITGGTGLTCVGTPSVATAVFTCSGAHYGVTSGEAYATSVTPAASGTNGAAGVSAAFFAGTGLSLSVSGTTWTVAGASAFNSAAGSYIFTTTGTSGSGTLTLDDSLYTYVEVATLSNSGLSVSIVENPNAAVTVQTPIATATIDTGGVGVLNYADGTTEPIAGGLIGY